MLRGILFDFDGTIAETERLGHRVAYNATFAEFALDWVWDEALYGKLLAVGGGKERIAHYIERYRSADGSANQTASDRDTLIRRIHDRKQQIFATIAPTIRIRPGVRRLIGEARGAGVRVAIATTASPAGVEALIGPDPNLRDAFACIAAGDVVAAKKPAPDIYAYVLERLALSPRDCVAIEDAAIGLRASRAAGIVTLITSSDYTRDEDFSGAAAILSDLGEAEAPARTLAGPAPQSGIVDIAYLRSLMRNADTEN